MLNLNAFKDATKTEKIRQYEEFKLWLDVAKTNDRFVYFTGNSLSESIVGTVLARLFMSHARNGEVYLVQRRIAPYVYDHIAIKASSPPIYALVPNDITTLTCSAIEYIGKLTNGKGSRKYG